MENRFAAAAAAARVTDIALDIRDELKSDLSSISVLVLLQLEFIVNCVAERYNSERRYFSMSRVRSNLTLRPMLKVLNAESVASSQHF